MISVDMQWRDGVEPRMEYFERQQSEKPAQDESQAVQGVEWVALSSFSSLDYLYPTEHQPKNNKESNIY